MILRRARSFVAQTFFEGLSGLAAFHPLADPRKHGVTVEKDVPYATEHGIHQTLDIYRPAARKGPWPVVFYVHGGGFHLLSKDTHWVMALMFARFGYMVVNISYRLAPQHPYPAALEDVCLAYRWLADNIEQLGGDPSRVALAGESAGGNLVTSLALMLAERRSEPFAQAVYDTGLHARAVMPFCAILEVSRPSRFAERRKIPRWVEGMMHDITASYLRGHELGPGSEAALELADPLRVIETHAAAHRSHPDVAGRFARQLPAFFAPVGTRDPLLDDTRRLARALDELGVPVEARYYPGGIHAFHAFVWDAVAQRCWRDALAFLDRHMR